MIILRSGLVVIALALLGCGRDASPPKLPPHVSAQADQWDPADPEDPGDPGDPGAYDDGTEYAGRWGSCCSFDSECDFLFGEYCASRYCWFRRGRCFRPDDAVMSQPTPAAPGSSSGVGLCPAQTR
jgi:hypothetical protein